jgi:DNA-entry nuclease
MSACGQAAKQEPIVSASTELHQVDLVSAGTLVFDLASVPAYSGQPYAIVNDNKPYFTDAETYSDLDSLGRCGVAYASVGKDLMLFRATVARRR